MIEQPKTEPTVDNPPSQQSDPFIDITSLYVGDLPKVVTQQLLYDTFNKVATVESARICHDSITGESRGYAFVNFTSHADAKKAKEELTNLYFDNQNCRISWQLSDQHRRNLHKANVFLKNIPKELTTAQLYKLCGRFGSVFTAKAVHTPYNKTGHGFVQYISEEDAKEAIQKLNGAKINNILISAYIFEPRNKRQPSGLKNEKTFTNVFVKNIPISMTKDEILKEFEVYGKINSSFFPVKEDDKSQQYYAIFNYENHEMAMEAVNKLNGFECQPGFKLFVGRHKTKLERKIELDKRTQEWKKKFTGIYEGHNLYVVGLGESATAEGLKEAFSKYGNLGSVKVEQTQDGKCRGFGYVYFYNPDEGKAAERELNGSLFEGRTIRVCAHQSRAKRFNIFNNPYPSREYLMMHPPRRYIDEMYSQQTPMFGRSGNPYYNPRTNQDLYQPGYQMNPHYPYAASRDKQELMMGGEIPQPSKHYVERKPYTGKGRTDYPPIPGEFPINIHETEKMKSKPLKKETESLYSKNKPQYTSINPNAQNIYLQKTTSKQIPTVENTVKPKEVPSPILPAEEILNKIKNKIGMHVPNENLIVPVMTALSAESSEELSKLDNDAEYLKTKVAEIVNKEELSGGKGENGV